MAEVIRILGIVCLELGGDRSGHHLGDWLVNVLVHGVERALGKSDNEENIMYAFGLDPFFCERWKG